MLTPALRRFFPFLNWPRPNRETLGRDCWAGVTVALVLIPQALAYATLAGMPAHTGLYAALLPSIVGVLWGSSALLAVGPVALTSLLVYGALAPIAQPGSQQWVELAIWLALYAGIMQFLLGALRGGRIANLVSTPVMVGFINAAAVIIIFSQLPALLGMELSSNEPAGLMERLRNAASVPMVPLFGCTAIALLLALRRFLPRLPGILIVTIGSIVVSTIVGYSSAGGNVVGDVPSGLPPLALPPAISWDSHQHLLPAALIIALISFTEAMSSCRVLARKTNEQWDENQELMGQGLAKVTAAFSGTFAVSGSFSRSALNLYSGAVSAWSTLFAAATVLAFLLFLTEYLFNLPKSVLAAIIIVPVLTLLDLSAFRQLFAARASDGVTAAITFLVTLLALPHLYWGVVAGVCLSLATHFYRKCRRR